MTVAGRPSAARSLVAPVLASLPVLAVLLGLGAWQLERRAWKNDLLAQIDARAYGAPAELSPAATWPAWDKAVDEYRRVRVRGRFLHEGEVLLHGLAGDKATGRAIQGFYVFTPLRRDDGSTVFVNRGIVPTELAAPASRPAGQVAGEVEITGLLRSSEIPPPFVPANDPAANRWFSRDIAAMAAARGLPDAAFFAIDADGAPNPGGWPRGGQTRIAFPNNHLQYAFTWFGLAATLVGVLVAYAWRRLHPPPADEAGPAAARTGI